MNAPEPSSRARLLGSAGLLAALTLALYLGTGAFEFVNYDDPDYVTRNPVVADGLSAHGLGWAFGFQAANWHPLTWLSHMLDVELFGLEPGPMHLVNAALHALSAGLLLLALGRLTGAFWPSLIVAGLFAFHPLRVQCVAWVSERKELLAALFFFLLLLAHERHARTRSRPAYLAGIAFLVLGCMAKPMLVTAPFVLLLLDRWPLGRFGRERAASLWLEKAPHLAVVAGTAALTWLAQRSGGAVQDLAAMGLGERVLTAAAGVWSYVRASVWPSGLAVYYPNPLLTGGSLALPAALGALVAVGGSLGAWVLRARAPAVFTGWFWFLGMLVPVVGLVQIGDQAWADRYAYLPTIGLALAVVFGLAGLRRAGPALVLAGVATCAALAAVTLRTIPHWRDSVTLFERALAVTRDNWIAHNNLGLARLERLQLDPDLAHLDAAREHLGAALRIRPGFGPALYNTALLHEAAGETAEAERAYETFLRGHPGNPEALQRLAALARARGDSQAAIARFEQAVAARPEEPRLWAALAGLLLDAGEPDRAANSAASAFGLDPRSPEANLVLASIALQRGELDVAGKHLSVVLDQEPPRAEAYGLLGRTRMQMMDLDGAREAFERAIQLEPRNAGPRFDLGTLLMRAGERAAAKAQFESVLDLRAEDPQALQALGIVALNDGDTAGAVAYFERALRRKPSPLAWFNLAMAQEQLGHWKDALASYEKGFELGPPTPQAALAAAWILATGPDEELLDGQRALELGGYAAQRQVPQWREVVAAALARAGSFDEAVQLQQEAVDAARNEQYRAQLAERLELYRAGKPYTRP